MSNQAVYSMGHSEYLIVVHLSNTILYKQHWLTFANIQKTKANILQVKSKLRHHKLKTKNIVLKFSYFQMTIYSIFSNLNHNN